MDNMLIGTPVFDEWSDTFGSDRTDWVGCPPDSGLLLAAQAITAHPSTPLCQGRIHETSKSEIETRPKR